ncbi:hypothetical protein PAXRUDRAFT_28727 [Paxillus rubicundulus Ve08.2h10]|uniref:Uncharacterized protein n=1 Tax=Paxillus rubicundulus Ve08.2h10 TaxID=930991 RepID=A0A0D0D2Z3_9AGAM|nr:hypothetical protein PAXRUDRAFT_28727 [Paxillus rubicundulus Ve08.2h10]
MLLQLPKARQPSQYGSIRRNCSMNTCVTDVIQFFCGIIIASQTNILVTGIQLAVGCTTFKWAPGTATEVAQASKLLSQSPDPADGNALLGKASEQANQLAPTHQDDDVLLLLLSSHVPSPPASGKMVTGPSDAAAISSSAVASPSHAVVSSSNGVASPSHAVSSPSNAVTGPSIAVDKGKGKEPVHSKRKTLPTGPSHPSGAPHHATHLNPVFTKAYVEAEEDDACQCQRAREQCDAAECAKHEVILYVWTDNGQDPDIYKLQQGFTYLHFFLLADLLAKVRLLLMLDSSRGLSGPLSFKQYNTDRGLWTTFDVVHMVNIDGNNSRILLKHSSITNCNDLNVHLHQLQTGSGPNILTKLINERNPQPLGSISPLVLHLCLMHVISLSSIEDKDEAGEDMKVVKMEALSDDMEVPIILSDSVTPTSKHKRHSYNSVQDFTFNSDSDHSCPSSPAVNQCLQSNIDKHGDTRSDAIDVDDVQVWPVDFHACDIEAGFQKCQQAVHA